MKGTRAASLAVVMLVAVAGHELSDAKAMVAGQAATQGAGDATRDQRVAGSARYDVVKPDYRGSFGGDSKALIAIRKKHGNPVKGFFQAKNTEIGCVDGTRPVVTLNAIVIRFFGPRLFQGHSYIVTPAGSLSYQWVKGRLSKDGRSVEGSYIVIENPFHEPNCGTFGRIRWHAERVTTAGRGGDNRDHRQCRPTHASQRSEIGPRGRRFAISDVR